MLFFVISFRRANATRRGSMDYLSTVEQRQIHEILGDFFRYRLSLRGTEWTSPVEPEVSADNAEICQTLRNLSDHFHAGCREALEELAERCFLTDNLSLRTLENGFHTSMNELMNERGVSWERIIVAFTYAVESAVRLPAQDPINTVYNWTTAFTARVLMPWIRANNGWPSVLGDVTSEKPKSHFYRNLFGIAGIAAGAIILGVILTNRS